MKLKNILLILSTIFYSCAFSQTPPTSLQPTESNITAGYYFTDNNINKFIGTWQWTSGTDTVIISLKKLKHTYNDLPPVFYQDWLYGCHTYIKNGQKVENTMQNISSTNVNTFHIVGYSNDTDSTKADINLTTSDRPTGHYIRYSLTLQYAVGSTPNKLIWHTYNKLCINCAQIISLPRDMILTKQ